MPARDAEQGAAKVTLVQASASSVISVSSAERSKNLESFQKIQGFL
jgi:hypothetical protein